MENEIYKIINGFEKYSVSNCGNIKNNKTNRILKKYIRRGYERIDLHINKYIKRFNIHHLVAEYFLDKIKGKNIIDHIDGNPSNNHYKNLRYCTQQENLRNRKCNKNNKLKLKNIYFQKNKYIVLINLGNDKKIHKRFDDLNTAILFRNDNLKLYFGEFAKYD